MSSLIRRLEALEGKSKPPAPEGAVAARRGLLEKFEAAIIARELRDIPVDPATLSEQSPAALAASVVAFAVEGDSVREGEARQALTERMVDRGRVRVVEKLIGGYAKALSHYKKERLKR